MISSTKELYRFSTLLTIVSALSILLAALPLLSLSPPIYLLIVMIVFVKILLTFSVTDYSFGQKRWKSIKATLWHECKELKNAFLIEIPEFAVERITIESFSLVILSSALFSSFI